MDTLSIEQTLAELSLSAEATNVEMTEILPDPEVEAFPTFVETTHYDEPAACERRHE